MMLPWQAVVGFLLILGGGLLFSIIMLDKANDGVYSGIHQHMCFERLIKEPWEVEPLGRIEQVGVKRVLVTMGRDQKPMAAIDAYTYGFTMTKEEFHKEYKEVSCLSPKP